MIGLGGGRAIFLVTGTTDLRKSLTGLYALVREHLAQEPLSGAIFAFCNRRRDTVKLFCYDAGGFCICANRLEAETFRWPVDDPRRAASLDRIARWRERFSMPVLTMLFTRAATELVTLPPKTALATALGYLLGQRAPLTRCVTTAGSSLDNNPVENAIRPLKLGMRNWLFIAIRMPGRAWRTCSPCSRTAGRRASNPRHT